MLRKAAINAGLVVASVLAALLVLEGGLRLYYHVPLLRITNFIWDEMDYLKTTSFTDYDERLGWRTRPNVHRSWIRPDGSEARVNTDAYGNRMNGVADRPVPQGAILAVGDSFTLGSGVSDEESWPAFLEATIGTPVVNASAGAWGTDQILMRTAEMIEVARPKMLLLGFLAHDILRAEYETIFGAHRPYYTIEAGKPVLHNVPVPRFDGGGGELGFARATLGYSYLAVWLMKQVGLGEWLYAWAIKSKRSVPEGVGAQITCLLMKGLKVRLEREQIRSMLVMEYQPGDFAGPQPAHAVEVMNCAREMGFDIVDIWSAVAAIYTRDTLQFRSLFIRERPSGALGHMSGAGNRLVAAAVAEQLRGR